SYHRNLNEEIPQPKETCAQRNQATLPAPSLTRELTHRHQQLRSLRQSLYARGANTSPGILGKAWEGQPAPCQAGPDPGAGIPSRPNPKIVTRLASAFV